MKKQKFFHRLVSLVCVLSFGLQSFGLANQSPPTGGPSDASPSTLNRLPGNTFTMDCMQFLIPDNKPQRDPILLTGGKFYLPVTDVEIPAIGRQNGLALKVIRSYSSQDGFRGMFGTGWVSSLDVACYLKVTIQQAGGQNPYVQAGSVISLRDYDGALLSFTLSKDTTIGATPGPIVLTEGQARIEWTPNTDAPLKNGIIRCIKAHGLIYNMELVNGFSYVRSLEDRNGNKITYHHDPTGRIDVISDDAGRAIEVTYNDVPPGTIAGFTVKSIKDPAGRIWTYNYARSTFLTSVVDPLKRTVSYGYAIVPKAPGSDPLAPDVGVMTSIQDAMGFITTYDYDSRFIVKRETKPDGKKLDFTFDTLLGTSSMTDEDLRVWNYEYVKIGLGTKVIDPDNGIWSYAYDPKTNLTTQTKDPLGHTTQYFYDDAQNLIKIIDPAGNTKSYTYDTTYNQWLTLTDFKGNVTTRVFDSKGNIISTKDAMGGITTMTYDAKGQRLSETDPNGNTSNFTYDTYGNMTSQSDALGNTTTFTYDILGRVLIVTNAKQAKTTFNYDLADRITSILLADGGTIATTYDNDDRVLTQTNPNGNVTTFSYDAMLWGNDTDCGSCSDSSKHSPQAHPTKITDPMGNITQFTYDSRGNVKSVTDANNHTTSFTYGIFDRLATTTDALGGVTTLSYDKGGNLIKVKDANNHETVFTYDLLDRRTSEADALGNKMQFTYDNLGNLIQRIDAKGSTTTYSYDALRRLIQTLYPDNTKISNQLDSVGNLLSMTDTSGITQYTYDKLNRLTKVTFPKGKTIAYAYDVLSNRKTLISEAGTIQYTYDILNRPTSVVSDNGTTSYFYDLGGRRIQSLYPNGIKAAYTYDKDDRLLTLNHTALNPKIVLPSSTYTYDPAGNRLTLKDNEGTHTYAYDALNRLVSVTYPVGTKLLYSYDSVGNRLSLQEGAKITSYAYDAANRLLSAGTQSFSYDPSGNTTLLKDSSSGLTATYDYDFENRLKKVTQTLKKTTSTSLYSYDGLGRRIQTNLDGTITNFYDDAFDTLFETNAKDIITRSYVQGPRIDEIISVEKNDKARFYLYDGLGSVTALSNPNGQVINTYNYDVFGATRLTTGTFQNRYQFTGRELDQDTNLYYYRNRYYNPAVGRFITRDPIGFGGGINLYSYVGGNPIYYVDPYGLFTVTSLSTGGTYSTPVDFGSGGTYSTPLDPSGGGIYSTPVSNPETMSYATPVCEIGGGVYHKRPFIGVPGSTVHDPKKGSRRYGPDGYPDVDVDTDHGHHHPGIEGPHAHDWGRPEGGGVPTKADRGEGRPVQPGDPL